MSEVRSVGEGKKVLVLMRKKQPANQINSPIGMNIFFIEKLVPQNIL